MQVTGEEPVPGDPHERLRGFVEEEVSGGANPGVATVSAGTCGS